ncbi:MAG: hypothetical protein V2I57_01850 [Xanthomonadales bacterium]|jgi:hypothetical protein|nr:hypothetical protein [Xanthomonadales bacterium]
MNRLPLSLAAATGACFLVACGGQAEPETANNPLLRYIPADTPFVAANLDAVPPEVTDAYLLRMSPFMEQFQAALHGFRTDLAQGSAEIDDPQTEALLDALLAEFDGKLNREGLESLGFSLEQMSVVYGQGLFPVLRAGLTDAGAVRAMVARVEANSGVPIPEETFQGVDYWRAAEPDNPMGIYVAILDDHFVLAAAPRSREAEFLPRLLGLEMPAEPLAPATLAELNRDKGFSPYGSGYLDLARVTEELFEADSLTATWMADMGDFDPAAIDPACEREARLVTTFVPRMVAGATEVTADRVGVRYQLETNAWLGGELARLVGDVPPASSDPGRVATISLNLQMGRVVTFLRESSSAMAAVPFQCPQLQALNAQVAQMAQNLDQPLPPFIGNLKGFRAEVSEFDPASMDPGGARGRVALEMESPQMVIGMASMMIPGFEELQIEPGGDPVEVPQEIMTVVTPEFEAYAVMSKDAIGISLGKGEKDGLKDFLEADGDPDGIFLSADYDAGQLARMQRQVGTQQRYSAEPTSNLEMDVEAMTEAYEAMLGRSRFELRLTEDGLTIDNTQDFR